MNKKQKTGTVYVLTNEAMPGLIKIGKTVKKDIKKRLSDLYTTGVPVPFECAYACRVKDVDKFESAFHKAFGPNRLNPKREFFEVKPEQVVGLLELLSGDDVTPEIRKQADTVDTGAEGAKEKLRQRRQPRPPLSFAKMGIPSGAFLELDGDSQTRVKVINADNRENIVELDSGEKMPFIQATRKFRNMDDLAPVRSNSYWRYKGRLLTELFEEAHSAQ